MKNVGWLVAIACLFLVPSAARAPYLGLLDRAPFGVTIVADEDNVGETALTVTVISGLRATQQVHATKAASGSEVTLAIDIGSNAKRVVFDVAPPKGGFATLHIDSNGSLIEEPLAGDTSFVFDIRP